MYGCVYLRWTDNEKNSKLSLRDYDFSVLSILASPEKVERLSILLFSFSSSVFLTFDYLSCFNHGSATKYAIVFSIGLRKYLRREKERASMEYG